MFPEPIKVLDAWQAAFNLGEGIALASRVMLPSIHLFLNGKRKPPELLNPSPYVVA